MLQRKTSQIVALLSALLLGSQSIADPIGILVDPYSSTSSVDISVAPGGSFCFSPCTATAILSGNLDAASQVLEVGDSWTFDFFDILVGGDGFVWDATISATLGLAAPVLQASGTGSGGYVTFGGAVSGGILTWDQPDLISLSDGTVLNIMFENIFEAGFGTQTTVSATISRNRVQVPEPGTLGLLGLALISIALMRRRRTI